VFESGARLSIMIDHLSERELSAPLNSTEQKNIKLVPTNDSRQQRFTPSLRQVCIRLQDIFPIPLNPYMHATTTAQHVGETIFVSPEA